MVDGSNLTLAGVKELLKIRVEQFKALNIKTRMIILKATLVTLEVGFQAFHFSKVHLGFTIFRLNTSHGCSSTFKGSSKILLRLLLLSSHCTKKAAQYWGGYCSILLVLHSVTLTLASARRPSKACHGLEASTGTKAVKKGCCWLAYCAAGFLSSQQPTCFLLSAERAFLFSTIEARQQGEKHGASL